MPITVEFFGIPRARVGVSQTYVCDDDDVAPLGRVIAEVSKKFPDFAETCTHDGHLLRDGYIANIDGTRFVRGDENELVTSGQSVLILSADAGG